MNCVTILKKLYIFKIFLSIVFDQYHVYVISLLRPQTQRFIKFDLTCWRLRFLCDDRCSGSTTIGLKLNQCSRNDRQNRTKRRRCLFWKYFSIFPPLILHKQMSFLCQSLVSSHSFVDFFFLINSVNYTHIRAKTTCRSLRRSTGSYNPVLMIECFIKF